MQLIDSQRQISNEDITDIVPPLLRTSARVSNSAYELVEDFYNPVSGDRKEVTAASLMNTYFGTLAHQAMYFYLLFSDIRLKQPSSIENVDYRSMYLKKDNMILTSEIVKVLFPLLSKLSVKQQVEYAIDCWIKMQDFSTPKNVKYEWLYTDEIDLVGSDARRALWESSEIKRRVMDLVENVDAFARFSPDIWKLSGSYLLESPYILTLKRSGVKRGGIQSWVQPDRLQRVDGVLSAVDYKFFGDDLRNEMLGSFDRVQIALLAVVAYLRSEFLDRSGRSALLSKPAMCTIIIDELPRILRNILVLYKNPERNVRGEIDEIDVSLSRSEIAEVCDILEQIAEDFSHPDIRRRFLDFQAERSYPSALFMPSAELRADLTTSVQSSIDVLSYYRART